LIAEKKNGKIKIIDESLYDQIAKSSGEI